MVFYLPENIATAEQLDRLTPREIVAELDKHVVGQQDAKRSVAVALRNRMRRQKLPAELAEEVMPKNIIMIGPTGVGKTEIARRLARLTNSPFSKVEASRFTEVGYVGRDVESMIRDLVEISIEMVREEKLEEVADRAEQNAEERLLDLLLPPSPRPKRNPERGPERIPVNGEEDKREAENFHRTREKLRTQLREGKLDDRTVEVDVPRPRCPDLRDYVFDRHRGDGHQRQRHPSRHLRSADEEEKDEGLRGARIPDAGRREPADRYGSSDANRRRAGRAVGHSLRR